MSRYKLVVYCISKNEEANVEKFWRFAKEADAVILLDTGSTDNTVAKARDLGFQVDQQVFNPWRFDHARNANLDIVPDDVEICCSLDLDEIVEPEQGWRELVEAAWDQFPKDDALPKRLQIPYIHDRYEDGSPRTTFLRQTFHSRKHFEWRRPCHVQLFPKDDAKEERIVCDAIQIQHYQDRTKPRNFYIPLLKLAYEEKPIDAQMVFWYGRELYWHDDVKAIEVLQTFLKLKNTWNVERSRALMMLADMAVEFQRKETCFIEATKENPSERKPWYELAKFYRKRRMYGQCLEAGRRALRSGNGQHYLSNQDLTDEVIYEELLIGCAWASGRKKLVAELIAKGLQIAPHSARLKSWYDQLNRKNR